MENWPCQDISLPLMLIGPIYKAAYDNLAHWWSIQDNGSFAIHDADEPCLWQVCLMSCRHYSHVWGLSPPVAWLIWGGWCFSSGTCLLLVSFRLTPWIELPSPDAGMVFRNGIQPSAPRFSMVNLIMQWLIELRSSMAACGLPCLNLLWLSSTYLYYMGFGTGNSGCMAIYSK